MSENYYDKLSSSFGDNVAIVMVTGVIELVRKGYLTYKDYEQEISDELVTKFLTYCKPFIEEDIFTLLTRRDAKAIIDNIRTYLYTNTNFNPDDFNKEFEESSKLTNDILSDVDLFKDLILCKLISQYLQGKGLNMKTMLSDLMFNIVDGKLLAFTKFINQVKEQYGGFNIKGTIEAVILTYFEKFCTSKIAEDLATFSKTIGYDNQDLIQYFINLVNNSELSLNQYLLGNYLDDFIRMSENIINNTYYALMNFNLNDLQDKKVLYFGNPIDFNFVTSFNEAKEVDLYINANSFEDIVLLIYNDIMKVESKNIRFYTAYDLVNNDLNDYYDLVAISPISMKSFYDKTNENFVGSIIGHKDGFSSLASFYQKMFNYISNDGSLSFIIESKLVNAESRRADYLFYKNYCTNEYYENSNPYDSFKKVGDFFKSKLKNMELLVKVDDKHSLINYKKSETNKFSVLDSAKNYVYFSKTFKSVKVFNNYFLYYYSMCIKQNLVDYPDSLLLIDIERITKQAKDNFDNLVISPDLSQILLESRGYNYDKVLETILSKIRASKNKKTKLLKDFLDYLDSIYKDTYKLKEVCDISGAYATSAKLINIDELNDTCGINLYDLDVYKFSVENFNIPFYRAGMLFSTPINCLDTLDDFIYPPEKSKDQINLNTERRALTADERKEIILKNISNNYLKTGDIVISNKNFNFRDNSCLVIMKDCYKVVAVGESMKIIRLKKDLPAKIYAGFLYRVLVEREYINLLKLTNKCGYYDSNNLFKESKNNGDITVAYLENSYIPKVPDYIQKAYFSQLQFEIDD